MKVIKEVRQVGTGNAVSGALVSVNAWNEGTNIGSGYTDTNGLAMIATNGSPGAARVRAERGASVYDDYSDSIQPASQFDLDWMRTRLGSVVTDGIVRSYGDRFRVTIGSGTITAAAGGVILDGILALFPSPTTISVTNGDRALVAVLTGDAVSLTEIDYSAIVSGTHVPLYRYTVSGGNVVSSSLIDIGRLAGKIAGLKSQIGIARLSSGTTLSAGGELAGLSTTLTLESGTYDIRARVVAAGHGRDGALAIDLGTGVGTYRSLNGDVAGKISNADTRSGVSGPASVTIQAYERRDTTLQAVQWTLQATYGPTFSSLAMSNPGQVAVDSTGRILIADTGNNRLVILNSDGTEATTPVTGLTGITGVCVDPSDNIYVSYGGNIRKYNSALVSQWAVTLGGTARHVATDGTHLFTTNSTAHVVSKNLCSNGGAIATWGSAGSGNGQFDIPFGIVTNGTHVWVSEVGNARIQKFTTAGVYVTQWAIPFGRARGLAIDASGNIAAAWSVSGSAYLYDATTGSVVDSFNDGSADSWVGVAVASGDVVWISNATDGTIAKWDEVVSDLPFEYDAALLTAIAIPR